MRYVDCFDGRINLYRKNQGTGTGVLNYNDKMEMNLNKIHKVTNVLGGHLEDVRTEYSLTGAEIMWTGT